MFAFFHRYKNIYGNDIILSYKNTLSNCDGCQFTLKNSHTQSSRFVVLTFTIIAICLFLPYIIERGDKCIYVLALFLLVGFLQSNSVKEEFFLLVPSVGLQYTTEYKFGRQANLFIHWQDINDIIINEVIHMHRIHYILTVIVEERISRKTYLVPLFVDTKPRLRCLELVYGEVQKILKTK